MKTAAVILMTIGLAGLFLLGYAWMTSDASFQPRKAFDGRKLKRRLTSWFALCVVAGAAYAGA